jgi:hypothetical protein
MPKSIEDTVIAFEENLIEINSVFIVSIRIVRKQTDASFIRIYVRQIETEKRKTK